MEYSFFFFPFFDIGTESYSSFRLFFALTCSCVVLLVALVVVEGELDVLDNGIGGVGGSCDGIDLLGAGILDFEPVPLVDEFFLDLSVVFG